MKTVEAPVSKALLEVWEAKRLVYEDTKDMTREQRMAYSRQSLENAARALGAKIVKNPDGTYRLV